MQGSYASVTADGGDGGSAAGSGGFPVTSSTLIQFSSLLLSHSLSPFSLTLSLTPALYTYHSLQGGGGAGGRIYFSANSTIFLSGSPNMHVTVNGGSTPCESGRASGTLVTKCVPGITSSSFLFHYHFIIISFIVRLLLIISLLFIIIYYYLLLLFLIV